MSLTETFKKIPTTVITGLTLVGTVVGVIAGVISLWDKVEELVFKTSKDVAIEVTKEVKRTEVNIGTFFIRDIRNRLIVVEDEINEYKEQNKPVPLRLLRKQRLLKEQLDEAIKKWGE